MDGNLAKRHYPRASTSSKPKLTIYVYDNNSTDGSDQIALAAGAVVRYETQQGKGNVVRRMFREIDADCYIIVDGDDTYPAEAATQMIALILQQHVDMVIGDRLSSTYFNQNTRAFHNFGNRLVLQSINWIFHAQLQDIMTGYRAFSRQFVKSFPVLSTGFEIETEMSIHAVDKRMQIAQLVIDYRNRPVNSHSKLNTISDGIKVLWTIFKMFQNYKPLLFFGLAAALLATVAVGFFIPLWQEYTHTGLVSRLPTLIACCFVMLTAIQSLFAGFILQNLRKRNLEDFEIRLHEIHQMYHR